MGSVTVVTLRETHVSGILNEFPGAESSFGSRQSLSYSRTSQHFMESEGSLPCSQEPSTGPYPEPDQSSPYRRSILTLSSHLRLGFPSGLLPPGILLLSLWARCPVRLILFELPSRCLETL
jgi:hypothetical protein